MQQSKRKLHIVQGNSKHHIVEGTTCFAVQSQYGVDCQRKKCKQWIDHPDGHNCVIIAATQQGQHTLQKIGQIYGLTRMRICQIEKGIFERMNAVTQ